MRIRTTLLSTLLLMAAACDREQADWEQAQETGTVVAYERFLEQHPDSPQRDEAEQRLRELRAEALWERARAADSAEVYRQYLEEFPRGDHADQARERVAEIERQQQWEALEDSTDIDALREFAGRHEGTPEAGQARRRADELAAAAREAEAREQALLEEERRREQAATHTHRVQLAAFQSEERAREGVDTLEQRLGEALADTGIEIEQSGDYYLLRTEPLPEPDARTLCEQLQAQGQDCLLVER